MGQNQELVHFREENAERKNGHTCKITTLVYPALHTPTNKTTQNLKNTPTKNPIRITRQIPNTPVHHGALS